MAWEERSGRLYYYRVSRGPGGRVARRYLGRGPRAEAAAAEDRARLAAASAAVAAADAERLGDAGSVAATAALAEAAAGLAAAALCAAGYRRSNYGKWRACRGR